MADSATWAAPGRVNLIGEHTDYNEGFALPFALPQGVVARATRLDEAVVRVRSESWPDAVELPLGDLEPGDAPGWAAYAIGVVWALLSDRDAAGGVGLELSSDVPVGAGLSSSAAVECAVAGAVAELFAIGLTPPELVGVTRRAENAFVGVPNGALDQSASVLCTAGHALFMDFRSMQSRQVPLPLAEQGLACLVIDTRAPHQLVDGEYAARRAQCEEAAQLLGVAALRDVVDLGALERLPSDVLRRRVRHIVTEDERVRYVAAVLESGDDAREIGPLLTESHVSMRDDFEISCPELDLAVEVALGHGAHGARMTGGGFGGSAIALVDEARVPDVGAAVLAAFAAAGMAEPHPFAVLPSAGARSVAP